MGGQDCTSRLALAQKLASLYTSMEYKPVELSSCLGKGYVNNHGTGDQGPLTLTPAYLTLQPIASSPWSMLS